MFADVVRGAATGSYVTGSDVTRRGPDRKYVLCMPRLFPAFFSYCSSSTKCNTVVQVPGLPKVTPSVPFDRK